MPGRSRPGSTGGRDAGYPANTVWVCFTWRLSHATALALPALPEGYAIRDARPAEAALSRRLSWARTSLTRCGRR
jgi:hypothetical protein